MRTVAFFMMTTLNGLYERGRWDVDPTGIDWHHADAAFEAFAVEQLRAADMLVFGRVTYEGMATYWPTPEAIANDSAVAERMNALEKLVVSQTVTQVDWHNSRLASGDIVAELRKLKATPGEDILILASSDLAASLAAADVIDEYRLMVNPVLVGQGKPVFAGLAHDIGLRLLSVRTFANGNVLLTYAPASRTEDG